MIRICIRLLAVLFIIALSTVAYGRELLFSLEKGNDVGRRECDVEKSANNADAEIGNSILDKEVKLIIQGQNGEIPFLVKSIKYKCIESNETIVFENSNQKLVYSIPYGVYVYYAYDCSVGEEKLSLEECAACARKGVYSVFSNFHNMRIIKTELLSDYEGVCTFFVKTTLTGETPITVSVRKDTGSIVLYDARRCTITG